LTVGELDGRVALVAGATGPIGAAVCAALSGRGASVGVHYHSRPDAATELAQRLAGPHAVVGGDLAAAGTADAIVAEVAERLGPVTALVNAAHPHGGAPAPVSSIDPVELRRQMGAVEAHVALCAAVVPSMRAAGWGRIVFISGALMTRPAPGWGAYGAAKAAASVLTRYLALEEGRAGITANVVAPGRVVDPNDPEPLTPELEQLAGRLLERMALPEFPSPSQVAAVVAQLVGPTGDAITGQTMFVTGGEPIT
jgi:NAD(P)-dependent dehydrogenase (short-subunit alcohol dehydrogenase family)